MSRGSIGRWSRRALMAVGWGVPALFLLAVLVTGWGHWSFFLRTPAVASRSSIEHQYSELLVHLREYAGRIPAEGSESIRLAIESDPIVERWCERPEVLTVTIRSEREDEFAPVYIDGSPPGVIGADYFAPFPFGPVSLLHGFKWPGSLRYEFVVYRST